MIFYNPNEEEVREVILTEGSFEINKIKTFDHIVPYKIDHFQEEEDTSLHLKAANSRQAGQETSLSLYLLRILEMP